MLCTSPGYLSIGTFKTNKFHKEIWQKKNSAIKLKEKNNLIGSFIILLKCYMRLGLIQVFVISNMCQKHIPPPLKISFSHLIILFHLQIKLASQVRQNLRVQLLLGKCDTIDPTKIHIVCVRLITPIHLLFLRL